jgi:hypothetical protein
MAGTPRLYQTLVQVVSPPQNWVARRPLKPLASMLVGLRQAAKIGLTAWTPCGHHRAVSAQSPGRRVARWREHERIAVPARDGPLIQHARAAWGDPMLSLALETSLWGKTSCLVRPSLVSRGRAMPRVWQVREPSRSRVAHDVYREG